MQYILESDLLFIIFVIALVIIIALLLVILRKEENKMEKLNRATKDRIDLESITKNIEKDYKPANIRLTSYEEEQENNAIISYDELLKTTKNNSINYDSKYVNEIDLPVKKVDLEGNSNKKISETKIKATLMSYEHEEAFLEALRQLQRDLVR